MHEENTSAKVTTSSAVMSNHQQNQKPGSSGGCYQNQNSAITLTVVTSNQQPHQHQVDTGGYRHSAISSGMSRSIEKIIMGSPATSTSSPIMMTTINNNVHNGDDNNHVYFGDVKDNLLTSRGGQGVLTLSGMLGHTTSTPSTSATMDLILDQHIKAHLPNITSSNNGNSDNLSVCANNNNNLSATMVNSNNGANNNTTVIMQGGGSGDSGGDGRCTTSLSATSSSDPEADAEYEIHELQYDGAEGK
jgi:hypothetical protein